MNSTDLNNFTYLICLYFSLSFIFCADFVVMHSIMLLIELVLCFHNILSIFSDSGCWEMNENVWRPFKQKSHWVSTWINNLQKESNMYCQNEYCWPLFFCWLSLTSLRWFSDKCHLLLGGKNSFLYYSFNCSDRVHRRINKERKMSNIDLENTFKILLATDIHLGYKENDPERSK